VAFRPPCRKSGHVPGSFRAKVPKSIDGFTIFYRWHERLHVGALRSRQKGDPGCNKVFVASQTWRWCRHYNWGLEMREVKLGLGKRYGYGHFRVAKQPISSLVKPCRQFTTKGKNRLYMFEVLPPPLIIIMVNYKTVDCYVDSIFFFHKEHILISRRYQLHLASATTHCPSGITVAHN
jgi:hypothetical protein